MEYDSGDGERYRRRLRKQRKYQAAYRRSLEDRRVPERDEVAGAALRVLLETAARHPDGGHGWIDVAVRDLVSRNYDEEASRAAIDGMVARHAARKGRRA